jgi:hypothetical protein
MEERTLVVLRRKLESLNYTERLDPASGPLVERLLADLVRTTDSYRGVKLQATKYAQEIATFNAKVRARARRGAPHAARRRPAPPAPTPRRCAQPQRRAGRRPRPTASMRRSRGATHPLRPRRPRRPA